MIRIFKILNRQISTTKKIKKKPKKHMYDIENDSWTKNKEDVVLQSISYNFKSIKSAKKKGIN